MPGLRGRAAIKRGVKGTLRCFCYGQMNILVSNSFSTAGVGVRRYRSHNRLIIGGEGRAICAVSFVVSP